MQRLSIRRFEEVKPIAGEDPTLPLPLVAVVNKAMELNPARRYQSPAEMLADLQSAKARMDTAAQTGEDISVQNAAAKRTPDVEKTPNSRTSGEGKGKTIMVVESDVGMQDVLRDQLKKHGYRVLVISDPNRALARFQDQHVADCVLFCSNNIGERVVRTFNDFGSLDRTRHIPAILLLGEKQKNWQAKVATAPHQTVLAMPISMKALRAAMKDVMDTVASDKV